MGEQDQGTGDKPQNESPAVEAGPTSDPAPLVKPIATGPEFKALTTDGRRVLVRKGEKPNRRSGPDEPKDGSSGGGDSGKE